MNPCLNNPSFSEALPYLPIPAEPLKVTLGIDEKKTSNISCGESLRLGKSTFTACIEPHSDCS